MECLWKFQIFEVKMDIVGRSVKVEIVGKFMEVDVGMICESKVCREMKAVGKLTKVAC